MCKKGFNQVEKVAEDMTLNYGMVCNALGDLK